jgi:hypothetical protein
MKRAKKNIKENCFKSVKELKVIAILLGGVFLNWMVIFYSN